MRRVSEQFLFQKREEAEDYERYLERRFPGPYDLRTFIDQYDARGVVLTVERWNSCD